MKNLKILGTGCAKCQKLMAEVESVASGMGIEYQIEKVSELQEIMKYGVMMTPALVVDGQVKVSGKIPSADEIKKLLA